MYCKFCGAQNADDAVFCNRCGKPIDPSAQSGDSSVEAERAGYTSYSRGDSYAGQSDQSYSRPGDMTKNWAAVSGLVLAMVSMLCSCFVGFGLIPALLGLIFGIIGLKSQNRGVSIAAIIIASVGILLSAAVIVGLIVYADSGYMSEFADAFTQGLDQYNI